MQSSKDWHKVNTRTIVYAYTDSFFKFKFLFGPYNIKTVIYIIYL